MSYTQSKGVKLSRNMVVLLVCLLVSTLVATGFASAYKKVHIIAEGNKIDVDTLYNSPDDVLAQAGITLGANDEYRLSADKLISGSTIEVFRAVPVTINYQGKSKTLVTGKPTVGEVAASLGFNRQNARILPGAAERVQAGMKIDIAVLSEKMVERRVDDPQTVIRRPDATMEKGVEEVDSEGQNGEKLQTVKVFLADGQQIGEEVVSEKIVEPSKPRVVRVGSRDTVETSRGSMRFSRVEYMEATAYIPTDGSSEGITASGIPARHGVVAVDTDVIPLGTRVYIPGYGMALAADTGGAIVGQRIDLCMESYSEAMRFGRRMVKVYVLE